MKSSFERKACENDHTLNNSVTKFTSTDMNSVQNNVKEKNKRQKDKNEKSPINDENNETKEKLTFQCYAVSLTQEYVLPLQFVSKA